MKSLPLLVVVMMLGGGVVHGGGTLESAVGSMVVAVCLALHK